MKGIDILRAPAPRVRCAICNKPVDRFYLNYTDFGKTLELTVYCHGDSDTMRTNLSGLSPAQIRDLSNQEGVAFETKRIGGAS